MKSKMKVFVGTFLFPLVMVIRLADVTEGIESTISCSSTYLKSGERITPLLELSFSWGVIDTFIPANVLVDLSKADCLLFIHWMSMLPLVSFFNDFNSPHKPWNVLWSTNGESLESVLEVPSGRYIAMTRNLDHVWMMGGKSVSLSVLSVWIKSHFLFFVAILNYLFFVPRSPHPPWSPTRGQAGRDKSTTRHDRDMQGVYTSYVGLNEPSIKKFLKEDSGS